MGIIVNTVVYYLSAIATVAVLLEAESALDIILNAMALFFLSGLDNEIVGAGQRDNVSQAATGPYQRLRSTDLVTLKFDLFRSDEYVRNHPNPKMPLIFSIVTFGRKASRWIGAIVCLGAGVISLILSDENALEER